MKVLFDHQIFSMQKFGGISRYFYELINYFRQTKSPDFELSLKYTNNYYIKNDLLFQQEENILGSDPYQKFLPKITFRGKRRLFNLICNKISQYDNKKWTIENLKKGEYDIFHPTYYDPYFLEYIGNRPFVLTVYDMIHEIFPEYFSIGDSTSKFKRVLAGKATKIIAISESTKQDIINFYKIDEDRIEVIYLASSLNLNINSSLNQLVRPEKYLLFIGNRTIYKNFYFFIRAISNLLFEDKHLYLICSGGGNFTPEEVAYFELLGVSDKIIYIDATNENLVQLYGNALAFIFPSLYEGFGIPVLEAFQCGCPVIASNSSSLTEIGGEAALYFDPKDILSIQKKVTDVIYDNMLRTKLREKGLIRAKEFSWEKAAIKTKELYLSVEK